MYAVGSSVIKMMINLGTLKNSNASYEDALDLVMHRSTKTKKNTCLSIDFFILIEVYVHV